MPDTEIYIEFDQLSESPCDLCGEKLKMEVSVLVEGAAVSQTGTVGFTKHFSAHLKTKVLGVNINHSCVESYHKKVSTSNG